MSQVEIKTYYSAAELAARQLPGPPTTERGIRLAADREGWAARRKSKGKGNEYALSSLPLPAQNELKQRQAKALLATAKPEPVVTTREKRVARREEQLNLTLHTVDQLTDGQRVVAEARCALVSEVLKVAMVLGKKKPRFMSRMPPRTEPCRSCCSNWWTGPMPRAMKTVPLAAARCSAGAACSSPPAVRLSACAAWLPNSASPI